MHRSLARCSTLAVVLVAGACATTGPHTTDPTSTEHARTRIEGGGAIANLETDTRDPASRHPIGAPTAAVFDQLPAAFQALGVRQVAIVDTLGGVYTVGVRNLLLHGSLGGRSLSTYVDCGTGAMNMAAADHDDVYLTATAYVTGAGATTSLLHTYVAGQARDPASNAPLVRCASTGRFEAALAAEVARRAATQ